MRALNFHRVRRNPDSGPLRSGRRIENYNYKYFLLKFSSISFLSLKFKVRYLDSSLAFINLFLQKHGDLDLRVGEELAEVVPEDDHAEVLLYILFVVRFL